MNENLDLTKILEGCPKGTEFYSSLFGNVSFKEIVLDHEYPIIMSQGIIKRPITKEGKYIIDFDGECTLFPSKDQRDWAKFERFWDKPKVDRFDPNTLQPFDKVLCRDYKYDHWRIDLFSHRRDDSEFKYECLGCSFRCCIPFNEETKHLIGTKEDCPEYYKWWEE